MLIENKQMKSSPKQGKNESTDINNGTNSPLGCQEVTAEQILNVISHPIFQNILQIIQKPLIEKNRNIGKKQQ